MSLIVHLIADWKTRKMTFFYKNGNFFVSVVMNSSYRFFFYYFLKTSEKYFIQWVSTHCAIKTPFTMG